MSPDPVRAIKALHEAKAEMDAMTIQTATAELLPLSRIYEQLFIHAEKSIQDWAVLRDRQRGRGEV